MPPDAVALGSQLGFLIMPAVVPIFLWVALNTRYLQSLAPGLARSPAMK